MSELGAATAAAELDELERQLTQEHQQVEDLKQRIHAMESEIASWRPAPKRTWKRSAESGFLVGMVLTSVLGKIILELVAR